MEIYADIILPVPLNQLFTYRIPSSLEQIAVPGSRVFVPLGKSRRLTGIIVRIHGERPESHQVKEVLDILDKERPSVLQHQLKLMKWMWEYCLCAPGDVMKAAVPSGLRPDSSASEKEFKPRYTTFVRKGANCPADSSPAFSKRAAKQEELFQCFLELAGYKEDGSHTRPVTRRALMEKAGNAWVLKALIDNGILEQYTVETGRLPQFKGTLSQPWPLTPAQDKALSQIHSVFDSRRVCLLHGVTSCGKTEIYISLIKEQIDKGRQVLYILPEIALTTQIEHRLQRVFGADMCVYHSGCSDNIRVEIWNRLTGPNPYKLILGARSAVMLPFQNLGLVIVDEEHEASFKQEDPAPRYHGRNTAIVLAAQCGAHTLLGSATPSIESYSNAISGKYGLVTLSERYRNMRMPQIVIVDTADLKKRKYMPGLFSPQLINQVNSALQDSRQAILFHNRRGYAGVVECPDCAWVQKCDCCDVSLTYHKSGNSATCHYCGRNYQVPQVCPSCGSRNIRSRGFGTERIEEEAARTFPKARIARLDIDSAKGRYESIIEDFQEGRTDILIGTQMVSKGLDFNRVSVVGIIQADSILSYPDFRATERGFQLMSQVAGRAGRKDVAGTVIVQTRQPDVPVLHLVRKNDYAGFYRDQMLERQAFNYPPYSRIVSAIIKGQSQETVESAAFKVAESLAHVFGRDMVLGPDAPPVSMVQYLHIRRIMVKISLEMSVESSRSSILKAVDSVRKNYGLNGVTVSFDADPQ